MIYCETWSSAIACVPCPVWQGCGAFRCSAKCWFVFLFVLILRSFGLFSCDMWPRSVAVWLRGCSLWIHCVFMVNTEGSVVSFFRWGWTGHEGTNVESMQVNFSDSAFLVLLRQSNWSEAKLEHTLTKVCSSSYLTASRTTVWVRTLYRCLPTSTWQLPVSRWCVSDKPPLRHNWWEVLSLWALCCSCCQSDNTQHWQLATTSTVQSALHLPLGIRRQTQWPLGNNFSCVRLWQMAMLVNAS